MIGVKRIPPAHGGAALNCSVGRDGRDRLRAKCWSHGCTEGRIVWALRDELQDFVIEACPNPACSRGVALRMWNESRDAQATLAHRYLKRRGITDPPPSFLRYHLALKYPSGLRLPGLVAFFWLSVSRDQVRGVRQPPRLSSIPPASQASRMTAADRFARTKMEV
jgi:hypothetical protein